MCVITVSPVASRFHVQVVLCNAANPARNTVVSSGYESQAAAAGYGKGECKQRGGCQNPTVKLVERPDPNEGFFEKAIKYDREQESGD